MSLPSSSPAGEPSMEDILASIRRILNEEEPVPPRPPASPTDAAVETSPALEPFPAEPPAEEPGEEDVLVLDPSMLVPDPAAVPPRSPEASGEPPMLRTSEAPHADQTRSTPERDRGPGADRSPERDKGLERDKVLERDRGLEQDRGLEGGKGPERDKGLGRGMIRERDMNDGAAGLSGGGLLGSESADTAASSFKSLVRTVAAERNAAINRGGPTIEDVVREEVRPLLKAWLDANLPPLVERLVRAEIERVVGRAVG